MSESNLQVLLAHRPKGAPQESDFRVVEGPVPEIKDGQFLIRGRYLSLDPYMRGRMNDVKSYAKPVEVGGVMEGEVAGEVVASRHPGFKTGEKVLARTGWQRYGASDGTGVRKVTSDVLPLSAHLGVLGMPGVTAYVGLLDIGQPKSGETVVVSAASGAVGSVVGQIAKIKGCRAVGIKRDHAASGNLPVHARRRLGECQRRGGPRHHKRPHDHRRRCRRRHHRRR